MPQDLARSLAADLLTNSSERVAARMPGLHEKLSSTVSYATQTRIGVFAMRAGDHGLSAVDSIIDHTLNASIVKRTEAMLSDVILPKAHALVESTKASTADAKNKVTATVVAIRAVPGDVKAVSVRKMRATDAEIRRRLAVAKCSAAARKVYIIAWPAAALGRSQRSRCCAAP